MSEHGATLQSYNQELVKYIEHLRTQKEKLNSSIEKDQKQKEEVLELIAKATERLDEINGNLEDKIRMRNECERTIIEAEAGISKIIESSQVLLTLVQREAGSLKF